MAWFGRKKDGSIPRDEDVLGDEGFQEEEQRSVPARARYGSTVNNLPDPPQVDGAGRRSVADHTDYLLSLIDPLPSFGMMLLDAHGHVLDEDIRYPEGDPSESAAQISSLRRGEILTDRGVGLLAEAGMSEVRVRPRPRVVVIGSGEYIRNPGPSSFRRHSMDAVSFLIAAAAKQAGATVFRVDARSRSREDLLRTLTDQLIRADLVVSMTGTRSEDYEIMVSVMRELGDVDTADVAMTPGSTQTFGLVGEDGIPMLLLPDSPLGAYVSFRMFGLPLLRKLVGLTRETDVYSATVQERIRSHPGQRHFLGGRVSLEPGPRRVTPVSHSSGLAELAEANAFIVIDEDTEEVRPGERVEVLMFR